MTNTLKSKHFTNHNDVKIFLKNHCGYYEKFIDDKLNITYIVFYK